MPPTRVRPIVSIQVLFVLFGVVIAGFFPFFAPMLESRGLSESQIGFVIAAMALTRVATNPAWGHVADTSLGRRRVVQLGMAGGALAALALFVFGHSMTAVVLACVALAATSSTTGPNIDALALAHLGEERMADYGRIRGWESLSYAASCLALGFLLEAAGVDRTLIVYAVASLAVVAWTRTIAPDRPAEVERHGRLGAVGEVFRGSRRFVWFLSASLLVWTAFSGAWNFVSLKILTEGGGPLLIGFGTALGGLVEVPVMRLSSRLSRRVGLRWVYVAGCIVYATGFLLWGLIDDPTIVSALTVFEGAGFALLFTSAVVIVGKLVPPALHATGQSVASTAGFGIAPIVGGPLAGFVFEHLGPVTLYVGASALALGAAGLAWIALDAPDFVRPSGEVEPGSGAPPLGSGAGLPPSEA